MYSPGLSDNSNIHNDFFLLDGWARGKRRKDVCGSNKGEVMHAGVEGGLIGEVCSGGVGVGGRHIVASLFVKP